MPRGTVLAALLATLLVGAALGVLARDALAPPAWAQVPPATNYEYQTTSVGREPTEEKADKMLNTFSREGWRFVGYIGSSNLLVFERARAARAAPRAAPPRRPPEEID